MNKFESMKVFVVAAEAGSFSAASELLGISSVMVGKHIHQLEKSLGVRLINRTTRNQSLTEAGRFFLADCKDILERVRVAELVGERMNNHPRGKVRITAPNILGSTIVTQILGEYMEFHSDVQGELILNDRVCNIIEEGFDIAIRIGKLKESSYLVARKLTPYQMLICASPLYIWKYGKPSNLNDLANHNCLNHLLWHSESGWESLDFTDEALPFGGSFASDNGYALRSAALSGFGIAMLPQALIWQDLIERKLVTLLDDFIPKPQPVYLLYPYDRKGLPKVTLLVDLFVKRLGV
ncbi:LysR family transcriptional regulator [Zooshikella harenae]|uniref:LysR family transcriptional regulator n=1 Tax=Zooshikella harenae TaxID=2827238 RepID=A0ABS5ZCD2_9GAMM|nr:LysR family transcriptional regulator [Zooshikella harenae]MBU2711714.1 LysR family transcriptional regulator [Zooshikella harenae]